MQTATIVGLHRANAARKSILHERVSRRGRLAIGDMVGPFLYARHS
jgi:hypothetical protein